MACNLYGNAKFFEPTLEEEDEQESQITTKNGSKFLKLAHEDRKKGEDSLGFDIKCDELRDNKTKVMEHVNEILTLGKDECMKN